MRLTHGWIGVPPCLWVSPQPSATPLTVEGTPDPRAPCAHGTSSVSSARFPPRSEDWTQALIVPHLDFKSHLRRLPAAGPCLCLSRGSGGHALGASQTSARLSTTRTSLPGPPGTSPASGAPLPAQALGLCGPFPAVPHCPGLSFPREAPAPLTPSPPPGFSHFLFGFGSFVLESHLRETRPGRPEQVSDRAGEEGTVPRGCALNAHPAGASGPRREGGPPCGQSPAQMLAALPWRREPPAFPLRGPPGLPVREMDVFSQQSLSTLRREKPYFRHHVWLKRPLFSLPPH